MLFSRYIAVLSCDGNNAKTLKYLSYIFLTLFYQLEKYLRQLERDRRNVNLEKYQKLKNKNKQIYLSYINEKKNVNPV